METSNPKNEVVRVLLVEDDEDDVLLMREMISGREKDGLEIIHADRLSAGLKRLAQGGIDIVLLDLGLPDGRGLETLHAVNVQAKNIPVVVLTTLADEKVARKAIREGAQDYLVKGQVDGSLLERALQYSVERHHMRASLEYQKEQVQASEKRLRDIIEQNADGILVVDREGLVLFINPAAEALFDRGEKEFLGKPFGYPLVEGYGTEIDIVKRGGEKAIAQMHSEEIEWEGEKIHLVSLRDITSYKRMLTELEETRLRQLQLKDQFLSHVSHELRSPLSVIHQFITILLDGLAGDLSPEQSEYLRIALRNADQLRTMIDELLEITRAETGKLTVELRRIHLTEVIPKILATLQTTAATEGVTLSADLPGDLPPVYADPHRVRQILVNLIENGIKYTPENGRITVQAQVSREDANFLCVAVADTGRGVRPEEKEKIFESLYQTENTSEAGRKGLGLGLYICKELVSRQGGRIWVESQPGHGSTFCFTLPIFSLANLLDPILTKENLQKGSVILLSVRVFPVEEQQLRKSDEKVLREIAGVIQSCILPDADVLLPRMARSESEELFFVVACCDQRGAEVLMKRIRGQLARFKDAGLEPAVSLTAVEIPSMRKDKPLEFVVKEVVNSIERLVEEAIRKRGG